MGPVDAGQRGDEQDQTGGAEDQGEPLSPLDAIAEQALGEDRKGDRAPGKDRLDEGDRRQGEGRDMGQPSEGSDPPAGDKPPRSRQSANGRDRTREVNRLRALTTAVLEQRGKVGQQSHRDRKADSDLHSRAFYPASACAAPGTTAGGGISSLRIAATAAGEVWQARAIVRFGASGARRISKWIRAFRRMRTSWSPGVAAGAASV